MNTVHVNPCGEAQPQPQHWLAPLASHFVGVTDGGKEVQIHYIDEGQGDPVVFVHGNPTWSFYFRKVIAGLRGEYRCIAMDHAGCGFSEKDPDCHYRLQQRSQMLEQFLDRLGIGRCHLVVHDWGGAIGMTFATRNPERVASVVVTNTAAFPSEWISWRINLCRLPVFGTWINKHANGFLRAAMHMTTVKPLSKEVKRAYLAPYPRSKDRTSIDDFVKDIPMDQQHPSYAVLNQTGKGLVAFRDQQILLLWGMRDFCFSPYFLARWQEMFPESKAVEYEDAGHFLFEEKALECVGVMREHFGINPIGAEQANDPKKDSCA